MFQNCHLLPFNPKANTESDKGTKVLDRLRKVLAGALFVIAFVLSLQTHDKTEAEGWAQVADKMSSGCTEPYQVNEDKMERMKPSELLA